MGLMDDVQASVAKMDEKQIRERMAAILKQREEQKNRQKEALKNLTPEQKAERLAKQKEYREKNADKFKAKRDAYNKRPEVVEKRKAYMKQRNAERTAILKRAKELGITVPGASA